MYANKSMGFRPWLQHAAASRLVAMLQNSISQAIQSYRSNVFSERGIATTEIDIEGDDFLGRPSEQLPFDERLRKLEQLRKEELITEIEYRQKRDELMAMKW